MKDIFEELKANATTPESYDFVPYEGLSTFSTMLYTEILRRNKNDCSIDWAMIETFKTLRTPTTILKNNSEEIAVEILRCYMKSKGEKIVAIPISIKSKKKNMGEHEYHANVLLFNTKLMTAEHYEPHGARDYTDEYVELNLKSGIAAINESISKLMKQWKDKGELKVQEKTFKGLDVITKDITITGKPPKQFAVKKRLFKYMTPIEVCPSPQSFKDFIGWQKEYDTGQNTSIFEGVKISETGGYCSAWSMFILDMRLQQLDKPAPETSAEFGKYLKEFRDNLDRKEDFVILIRGYVKQVFEAVKKLVAEGKFSLKDFGIYYGYQQFDDRDKMTEEKSQELFGMSKKEVADIWFKVLMAMEEYSRDYLTKNVRKDYKTTTKSVFD